MGCDVTSRCTSPIGQTQVSLIKLIEALLLECTRATVCSLKKYRYVYSQHPGVVYGGSRPIISVMIDTHVVTTMTPL